MATAGINRLTAYTRTVRENKRHAIGRRTARCHCKYRHVGL